MEHSLQGEHPQQVGKADEQHRHSEVSHKLYTPRHNEVGGKGCSHNITQAVPQSHEVVHLTIEDEYEQREWRCDEDYKVLDDVGCDDIQIHWPDGDDEQSVAQAYVDVTTI